MSLACERLTVIARTPAGAGQVESVAAERNVEIEIHEADASRCAYGDAAVYTADTGEMALLGNQGVELAFVDPRIAGSGSGVKAVYVAGADVLHLTGNDTVTPVVITREGEVSGDTVTLDHARTMLSASGNWRMTLNPETLRKGKASAPEP
jgi:lipopolysaccharide export system protein LptA